MPTATPLRELRRQQTEELICSAAVDLVSERGWSAVTVDDIAAAAGVSRRTFFNYFPTKEEALAFLPPLWDAEALTALQDAPGSLVDALEVLLLGHAHEVLRGRDRAMKAMRLIKQVPELLPRALARFEEIETSLAAAIARRTPGGNELESRLLAAMAIAGMRVAFHEVLTTEDSDPAPAVRRVTAAMRTLTAR